MFGQKGEIFKSLIIFLILFAVLIPVIVVVHELGHVIVCEYYGAKPLVVYIFGGNHIFSGITYHDTIISETASIIISLSGGYFTALIFTILYFCIRPSIISAQILMPFIIFQQLVYGTFEGLMGWPEVESQWILLNVLYGIILLTIIAKKTPLMEMIRKQKAIKICRNYIYKTKKSEVIKNIKEV